MDIVYTLCSHGVTQGMSTSQSDTLTGTAWEVEAAEDKGGPETVSLPSLISACFLEHLLHRMAAQVLSRQFWSKVCIIGKLRSQISCARCKVSAEWMASEDGRGKWKGWWSWTLQTKFSPTRACDTFKQPISTAKWCSWEYLIISKIQWNSAPKTLLFHSQGWQILNWHGTFDTWPLEPGHMYSQVKNNMGQASGHRSHPLAG